MRVPVLTHSIPWNPPYGEDLVYYRGARACRYISSKGYAYTIEWALSLLEVYDNHTRRRRLA